MRIKTNKKKISAAGKKKLQLQQNPIKTTERATQKAKSERMKETHYSQFTQSTVKFH